MRSKSNRPAPQMGLAFCALWPFCWKAPEPPAVADPGPAAVVFDSRDAARMPLPNQLLTASGADPLAELERGTPLSPIRALAYINHHEVDGTHAVSGVNAPIYLRFTAPLRASTVTAQNIKVFKLDRDPGGASENNRLGFQDVTGRFRFDYPAGSTGLWLYPRFPLEPGTHYLYLVTNRVLDAAGGRPVQPVEAFRKLLAREPLTGDDAHLEPIRANAADGGTILFSGFAKVLDDLITAADITAVNARDQVAVLGRFVTSNAGSIAPDIIDPAARIPMETALRRFAQGAGRNGLPGKTWDDAITLTARFVREAGAAPGFTGTFWAAATGRKPATLPDSIGEIALGTIASAALGVDPVVVREGGVPMDLSGTEGAVHPRCGVVVPFRDVGRLTGFHHVPVAVPFIYVAPRAPAPDGGYPLVLFQHGICQSKEHMLEMAGALTAGGHAAVAIDLPCHGELARPAVRLGPGDDRDAKDTKRALWAVDLMALGAPLQARTHIQEAAFHLHRLELTAAAGGFSILGAKAPSTTRMSFIGTSLGSIVGAGYLAGNAPFPADEDGLSRAMKGLLNVTGGRVVYLLKDSPAYGPLLDVILKTMNVEKDTPLAHAVLQLTQTVLDTVDPAAMTTPTAPDAPSRLSGRILIQEATSTRFQGNGVPLNGDLAVTNAYTRYLGDALGGREVLGLAQVRMVAPGFCQLGYGSAKRIPAPFLRTLEAGVEIPKTVPAARVGLGWGPGEGYFQFDQRGIHHGSLLEPGLMQSQALHWLESSLAVDPTP